MGLLKAEPRRWYSWDFVVQPHDTPADAGHNARAEARALRAEDTRPLAEIHLSGWREGRVYTLEARAALRRAFVVLEGTREIGSLDPDGAWTRSATVNLPNDWPLPLQMFAIWLTLIMWKRDSESAAAV